MFLSCICWNFLLLVVRGTSQLTMTSLVIVQELEDVTTNINSANLSSEHEPQSLATEVQYPRCDNTTWNSRADTVDHPEVPGLGTVGPTMVSTVLLETLFCFASKYCVPNKRIDLMKTKNIVCLKTVSFTLGYYWYFLLSVFCRLQSEWTYSVDTIAHFFLKKNNVHTRYLQDNWYIGFAVQCDA